jgi:hypothetical protein
MVLAAANFNVIGGEIRFGRMFNDTENKLARSAKSLSHICDYAARVAQKLVKTRKN